MNKPSLAFHEVVLKSIHKELYIIAEKSPKIFWGLLTLFIFYFISRMAVRALNRVVRRHSHLEDHKLFLINLVRWTILFIGISVALQVMELGGLANKVFAGGGILAVALGFAFKDIGENLIAGIMLAFNRPFAIGNTIESGRHKGQVQSIQLRYTHVRSFEGKDIYIPSSQIIKEALVNHSANPNRRSSFTLGIGYEEDLKKVIDLTLYEIFQTTGVLKKPKPNVQIQSFDDLWITLNVSFWIDTEVSELDHISTVNQVMNDIREKLLEEEIKLSFQIAQATLQGDKSKGESVISSHG